MKIQLFLSQKWPGRRKWLRLGGGGLPVFTTGSTPGTYTRYRLQRYKQIDEKYLYPVMYIYRYIQVPLLPLVSNRWITYHGRFEIHHLPGTCPWFASRLEVDTHTTPTFVLYL